MSLKSFLNKKLLPIYQNSVRQVHELQYIFFELTNECNLACLHCGSDCIKDSTIPNLPSEVILEVLKGIKSKYNSHKITVVLSGGEPLSYPGVFKLGKRITELEFPWGMVTNGYAWNSKRLKEAKEASMQSVTISLDGLEEAHNWLRGKHDAFKRAVNTIRMLVKNPFYQIMDVITCINKRNINTIDEIYELIKKLGVKRWRLFSISPIGRAVKYPELFLNRDEFKLLFRKIAEYKKKNEIIVNYSESDYFGAEFENKIRDHYYFCRAGINIAGIMVNGDMLACPNIDRRFKQGNIYTDSFIDVWENKYQIFRDRKWMKTNECKNCKEWKLCKGNSFHLWDIDNNKTKLCHYNLLRSKIK